MRCRDATESSGLAREDVNRPRTGVASATSSQGANLLVVAAVGVLLLAGLVLQPVTRGGDIFLTILGFPLPTLCWFKLTTGIPCAGCGLTRSVALLLHGHPEASLAIHPFGSVAVALALFQLPPRLARGAGSSGLWVSRWDRIWATAAVAAIVLMFVWWVARVGFRPLLAAWIG